MKSVKSIILITTAAMLLNLTGCQKLDDIKTNGLGTEQINIDDPANANVTIPGMNEDDNIDVQVQKAIDAKEEDKDEYYDLNDKELAELKTKILSFHSNNSSMDTIEAVKHFEELRYDMNLFAYNVIKRSDCEALITDMQTALARSRFKIPDTDSDGISDYYEMMVSNTSPLLNKTYTTKLDSQERYDIAFLSYVTQSGSIAVIQPEFSKMFYNAISNGNIKPLNNQFVVLNLRAYGRELDALRFIVEDKDNEDISSIMTQISAGLVYPISFRLTGSSISSNMSGNLDIEHMDYSSTTKQESIIIQSGEDVVESSQFIDFLARTPTSTSLPPDDSIAVDRTYTLVFPYEKSFEKDFSKALLALHQARHPELYEKNKKR